ncbi:MAG: tetratricopeptide repeat protein [Caldilineaceae bacterium]|nr:tetratricopeptide repeat protein [Caldilineaceae bacterium]
MPYISNFEQATLQKLTVFRGGFTREAAQTVVGATDATLAALTRQLRIHLYPNGRYVLQEIPQQSSAEFLMSDSITGEATAIHDAHSAFYCAFLAQRMGDLKGPRQQAAIAEIEAESENVRAAWQWAVNRARIEQLAKALDTLGLFYLWQNRLHEGEAMCQPAVTRLATMASDEKQASEPQARDAMLAQPELVRFLVRVFLWLSRFYRHLKQNTSAQQALQQARSWLGDPSLASYDTRLEQAQLLHEEAEIAYGIDRKQARICAAQALAIVRTLDDPWHIAQGIDLVARGSQSLGLLARARTLTEEGLALRQTMGDIRGIGESLKNLSHIARWEGRFEEAEELIHQSIVIFTTLHDPKARASAVHMLIGILVYSGKFTKGLQVFEEPSAVYRARNIPGEPVTPTVVSAFALMHLGRYAEAEARFQQTLSFYPKLQSGYTVKNLGRIAMVRGSYGAAQAHLLEALALFRTTEDTNGLGQTLGCLGIVALRLGDLHQARNYLEENLQLAARTLILLPSMTALAGLALLSAEEGDREAAVMHYTVALQSGHVANSRWYHDVVGQHITAVAESLPATVAEAAQKQAQVRDWRDRMRDLVENGTDMS